MTNVTSLQKLVVASVFAVMTAAVVLVASLEKPSCSAASQDDPRASICRAVNGY